MLINLILCGMFANSVQSNYKIAILSEHSFHQEVVLGFIEALHVQNISLFVFLPSGILGRTKNFGIVQIASSCLTLRSLPSREANFRHFDLLLFVSPEYNAMKTHRLIKSFVEPRILVFVIHNGDAMSLRKLVDLHPKARLIALAPHVRNYVIQRWGWKVDWFLPTPRLFTRPTCFNTSTTLECRNGFAVQVSLLDSVRVSHTDQWNAIHTICFMSFPGVHQHS